MSRFSLFLVLINVIIICAVNDIRLLPENCQTLPKEKHCLIEYMVRYRWPHQIRYVYNWYTKSCFEIRWSANCPSVAAPTATNNFPTELECLQACGGWA